MNQIQNLKPETVPFSQVNPAAYNPRVRLLPGDPEYQQILASLRQFGYLGGMVWNKGTGNLVGGHQRMWIMQDAGLTEASMVVVDLAPAAEKDLNIRLNKVGGKWDIPQLEAVLKELGGTPGIDMTKLGFNPVELAQYLKKPPKKLKRDPDAAPRAPRDEDAVSKRGDLYVLTGPDGAQHRLMCGDSEDLNDFKALMGDTRARFVFTDPPYVAQATLKEHAQIINDDLRGKMLQDMLERVFALAHAHSHPKAAMYCFYASRNHIVFETALRAAGWEPRQQLIWTKQMVLGRSNYHWSHEPILYCGKAGSTIDWLGPRTEKTLFEISAQDIERLKKEDLLALCLALKQQTDVWDEQRDPPSLYIHPTQKPTSLARRAMRDVSQPKDAVLDCFAGSGSTIIAAEQEDRVAYAMEQSAGHCDSIVRRFLETFESSAERNGAPFALEDLK